MKQDKNKGLRKFEKNELKREATDKKDLIVQTEGSRQHTRSEAEEI